MLGSDQSHDLISPDIEQPRPEQQLRDLLDLIQEPHLRLELVGVRDALPDYYITVIRLVFSWGIVGFLGGVGVCFVFCFVWFSLWVVFLWILLVQYFVERGKPANANGQTNVNKCEQT